MHKLWDRRRKHRVRKGEQTAQACATPDLNSYSKNTAIHRWHSLALDLTVDAMLIEKVMNAGVDREKSVRILIADDYAPWRAQVRSLLKTRPEWNIIGEASDGQQAIEKANEMQPDIILLDVGMPSLNGIEAAKIIHQRCSKSKILFVTQDGDRDIRNAAIRVGVAGYLLKANAAHELVEAIATALGNP